MEDNLISNIFFLWKFSLTLYHQMLSSSILWSGGGLVSYLAIFWWRTTWLQIFICIIYLHNIIYYHFSTSYHITLYYFTLSLTFISHHRFTPLLYMIYFPLLFYILLHHASSSFYYYHISTSPYRISIHFIIFHQSLFINLWPCFLYIFTLIHFFHHYLYFK